jgi:phenylalanyl-tRNA synthetase alpha chain
MIDLRANELKVLTALAKLGGKASVYGLIDECGLSDSAVMRGALELQDKALITVHVELLTVVRLNDEGRTYSETGLPERRLINAVQSLGGEASLAQASQKAGVAGQFVNIALGWTQRKKWATLDSKSGVLKVEGVAPEGSDEKLLRQMREKAQISLNELDGDLQQAVQTLKKRQLLTVEDKTLRILEATEEGKQVASTSKKTVDEVTQLTPELIISGKWRDVKMQKYNIEAAVANTWSGKKHPYLSFLEEVRAKLVTLGFKEMTGTSVETSFFNFDALFTPQDHPARDIFGIYLVKEPEFGDIGASDKVLAEVKETHENGGCTGSTGWGYKYSVREAKRLILRGHGTCLSARTLLSKDLKVPSRYFSIARCYRPEVLDKTHLSEFNQVEGIIVDENLTLRDLLGVLGKFALEIAGADKVRFKPDYFPFTEPSVELSAYKEGYGWVEFGGSGIFRPEVTIPLGIKVPVIAWGLGVDRLFMMRAGVDDIRYIFSQNLDWLRRKQVV